MQVKGRLFHTTIKFIKKEFGEDKLRSFFSKYPGLNEIQTYSYISWYPVDTFLDLSEKTDKFFGFGDKTLLTKLGKFSAETALYSSHKLFKGLPPQAFIENAPALLSSYYSSGNPEIEHITKQKVKLLLRNFTYSTTLSKRIKGWLLGCLKGTGAKNISVNEFTEKNFPGFNIQWE